MKKIIIASLLIISAYGCSRGEKKNIDMAVQNENGLEMATFAGGCFWCIETPFENIPGVVSVVSGYAGGKENKPSYQQVSSGTTSHRESVHITFNPDIVSYAELLDLFWKQFDPTDAGGSFYDRGMQYTSAIFYHNKTQKHIAEQSKKDLDMSEKFSKPIVTEIKSFTSFYPAEDYHQDYYKKDPIHYKKYRAGSGRDSFILSNWGNWNNGEFEKPTTNKIKMILTDLQYKVTQEDGTEMAFQNEYWDNKKPGIYVDVVSGEPLFSPKDKYASGTGWPSFTKPIDIRLIDKVIDKSYGGLRIEVRSHFGNSHLGHVFNDGPAPTHLRYCMNSASLKFIPKNEMKAKGYADYVWLVE